MDKKIIACVKLCSDLVLELELLIRLFFRPFLSALFFAQVAYIPYANAAPAGANIIGGSGNINQSGLTTTINQNTSSLAIDWNSFNINSNW